MNSVMIRFDDLETMKIIKEEILTPFKDGCILHYKCGITKMEIKLKASKSINVNGENVYSEKPILIELMNDFDEKQMIKDFATKGFLVLHFYSIEKNANL